MCGIFGISGHPDAVKLVALGARSLEHRGKDSSGIATIGTKDKLIRIKKDIGLSHVVLSPLNPEFRELASHPSRIAATHTRWTTAGKKDKKDAQPQWSETGKGKLVVLGNGDITNYEERRKKLEKNFSFLTGNDSELFAHEIAEGLLLRMNIMDAIARAMDVLKGAFSNIILYDGTMYACRDPWGIRPLVLGKKDGAFIVASETCALDEIKAQYLGEIRPGELLKFEGNSITRIQAVPVIQQKFCIFEHVYFSRPDSLDFSIGKQYGYIRDFHGVLLAEEHPIQVDAVIPVFNSGLFAACAYARELRIPLIPGIITEPSIGRTFTEDEAIRTLLAQAKYKAILGILKKLKSVVVIDDSIVRLTTMPVIVNLLHEAGIKEIHLRIPSPPVDGSCYFGQATRTLSELAINKHGSIEEIRKACNYADSLEYLSLENLIKPLAPFGEKDFCTGCFDRKNGYPYDISHLEKW